MKHYLPIERTQVALAISILVTILCSGCITMPHNSSLEAATTPSPDPSARQLDLNAASAAELEQLPGIGKTVAERIVSYRERYGPFRRPEHLMMVRGISEEKFRAIRHRIVVK
jgi:competence ComEA-like helix-hairpin-helix protein